MSIDIVVAQLVICPVPEVRLLEVGKPRAHRFSHYYGSVCVYCGAPDEALNERPCIPISDLSPTTRKGGFGSSGR